MNCNLNFKYFIAKYLSNMPAGVLKCFPSLLPHNWLRMKLTYNNTISSFNFVTLYQSSTVLLISFCVRKK
jgi:hypothetical protein